MGQAAALIGALKQVLKARGYTYARVAQGLGVSEATVKRVFAARTFTLQRLEQICGLLGIGITDLARMVAHGEDTPTQLTLQQEKELVSDPKLLLVAVHALNHWTLEELTASYALTKAECIRLLARLDRIGIIDLLPTNKVRVRVARNFAWLPDGPIQQYFRSRVQHDFFRSRFDQSGELMVFVSGMLSRASNAAVQQRMRRLREEFSELHHEDLGLPLDERAGTSLLIALRPWAPDAFQRLQRKKGS